MKIGIISDPHLGVYGDEISESGLNARLEDYTTTLNNVVGEMINAGVKIVLLGGDAVKHKNPSPTVLRLFQQQMHILLNNGINIVSITGNHDIGRINGEYDALQPLVNVPGGWSKGSWIHATSPRVIERYYGIGKEKLSVACLPYPQRQQLLAHPLYHDLEPSGVNAALSGVYTRCMIDLIGQMDRESTTILLAHAGPAYATTSADQEFMMARDMTLQTDLIPDWLGYAFFGHVHKPQELLRVGRDGEESGDFLWVVGSTEQKNFGEEGEEKRWLLLDTGVKTILSCPTGCRKHRTIDIDLTCDDPTEGETPRTPIACDPGDIVRVRMKMRRGQEAPLGRFRDILAQQHAHNVSFVRDYITETRAQAADLMGEAMTHGDVFRHYMATRNHGFDSGRAERIVDLACSMLPREEDAVA